jgi:hypothetical protein
MEKSYNKQLTSKQRRRALEHDPIRFDRVMIQRSPRTSCPEQGGSNRGTAGQGPAGPVPAQARSHMNWVYWDTAWSLFFSLVWFMTITHHPDAQISDAHFRDEAFGG